MARAEREAGLEEILQTNWEYSWEFVDMAIVWGKGKPISEVYKLSDSIYEGNFIRNMLKLRSLCASLR